MVAEGRYHRVSISFHTWLVKDFDKIGFNFETPQEASVFGDAMESVLAELAGRKKSSNGAKDSDKDLCLQCQMRPRYTDHKTGQAYEFCGLSCSRAYNAARPTPTRGNPPTTITAKETLKEQCRQYWMAPQNKEQYQRLRLGLQTQFYYLTETQLTEAFLSTMNAAELPDILRNMVDPPQRISPSTARLLSLNGSRRPAAPLRVSTSASWILPSLLLLICQAPHLHHLHLSLELTWDLSLRL